MSKVCVNLLLLVYLEYCTPTILLLLSLSLSLSLSLYALNSCEQRVVCSFTQYMYCICVLMVVRLRDHWRPAVYHSTPYGIL